MDQLYARAFANGSDHEQANFINEAARLLFFMCNRQGSNGFEQQCCYIYDQLNVDGKRFIKEIHAFLELDEKEKNK